MLLGLSVVSTSCADEHFFPKVRSLFPGMNEAAVPAKARPALAKAKVDFQLARHAQAPQYAHYVGTAPGGDGKVYEGEGYRLTMVSKEFVHRQEAGPAIVLDPSITGGGAYRYDEISYSFPE